MREWVQISAVEEMCEGVGNTHIEYTDEYRLVCQTPGCGGWQYYNGMIRFRYSCGKNH